MRVPPPVVADQDDGVGVREVVALLLGCECDLGAPIHDAPAYPGRLFFSTRRADMRRGMRREVYRGRIVDLGIERVTLPNGTEVDLEVIRHKGASAVAAVDDAGRVTLIRQFRHAAGGVLLGAPPAPPPPPPP